LALQCVVRRPDLRVRRRKGGRLTVFVSYWIKITWGKPMPPKRELAAKPRFKSPRSKHRSAPRPSNVCCLHCSRAICTFLADSGCRHPEQASCARKPRSPALIDHVDVGRVYDSHDDRIWGEPFRGEEVLVALGAESGWEPDAVARGGPVSLAGRPARGACACLENLQSASHAGSNAAPPKGSICRR
jgi:hypothetical protein